MLSKINLMPGNVLP